MEANSSKAPIRPYNTLFSGEKLIGWIVYNLLALGLLGVLITILVGVCGYEMALQAPISVRPPSAYASDAPAPVARRR